MAPDQVRFISRCEEETWHLGGALATLARAGDVIALSGDLGAGKTVFARGFVQKCDPCEKNVTSPTFTILNLYNKREPAIHHFDLYRLEDPQELAFIGGEEFLPGEGIALVEWPEKGEGWLPRDRLTVFLLYHEHQPGWRWVTLRAGGERSLDLLNAYQRQCTHALP